MIPNQNLETPHYDIERIRGQDAAKFEGDESYEMVKAVDNPNTDRRDLETPQSEVPAVKEIARNVPKPSPTNMLRGSIRCPPKPLTRSNR